MQGAGILCFFAAMLILALDPHEGPMALRISGVLIVLALALWTADEHFNNHPIF